MKEKKTALGFSVMDLILLILVVVCILSAVFRTQIHHFLGQEERISIQYTFLIQNASEDARNYPKEGEEIRLSDSYQSLGVIGQIMKSEKEYREIQDPEDTLKLTSLTCQAKAQAYETKQGFTVGSVQVKPGSQFFVQTESASFTMIVTMVKAIEE